MRKVILYYKFPFENKFFVNFLKSELKHLSNSFNKSTEISLVVANEYEIRFLLFKINKNY